LVIKLRDLEKVASIFVTHDLRSATTLATEFAEIQPDGEVKFKREADRLSLVNTRFLMLKDGTVFFEGSEEALKSMDEEYVREFLS